MTDAGFSKRQRGIVAMPAEMRNAGPAPLFDNTTEGFPALELLTIFDTAELLKISPSTVRRLQQARKIPFVKVGGSIRFLPCDLQTYVEKARVGTIGQ